MLSLAAIKRMPAGAIIMIPVGPRLLGIVVSLVKMVLRLDGRSLSSRQLVTNDRASFTESNLGPYERLVISKYGGDRDS